MGETYESLSISEDKNKTAQATLKLLVDPTFIFWATHMRLIYTLVYKSAFSAVQANHHHAAPELAGPDGLPVRWAATFRSAVIKPARGSGKVSLSETVCAPLVALLRRHPSLGGLQGEVAAAVAADFEAQAAHVESYFSKWNTLEALAHALARELTIKGPLSEAVHRRAAEQRGERPHGGEEAEGDAHRAARAREREQRGGRRDGEPALRRREEPRALRFERRERLRLYLFEDLEALRAERCRIGAVERERRGRWEVGARGDLHTWCGEIARRVRLDDRDGRAKGEHSQ